MKKTDPFDILYFAFPEFKAWFWHFSEDKMPFDSLNSVAIHLTLDYLETVDTGLLSLLLGYYLAKSELPSNADPKANGALH